MVTEEVRRGSESGDVRKGLSTDREMGKEWTEKGRRSGKGERVDGRVN